MKGRHVYRGYGKKQHKHVDRTALCWFDRYESCGLGVWSAKYATQQKWYSKQEGSGPCRPSYMNSSILEPMVPLWGLLKMWAMLSL